MRGKQGARARDGGREDLGLFTGLPAMTEDRPDSQTWNYWRDLSKEIHLISVLENGPAGMRKKGWEKRSSGRRTIRRRGGEQRGVGVGTVEISEYQRQAKSERRGTEASDRWL